MSIATFRRRAETETGFFARNVCGYNFHKDWETGEIIYGEGGIQDEGPHLEMTSFLDNKDTRFKHLEAPRGSFKTSILEAYGLRHVLANREIRVLYGMETYGNALQTLDRIKGQLESDRVTQIWGDVKGSRWTREALSLKGKSGKNKEPNFSAFGVDKTRTGGHYDIIIADDLVNKENVRTKEGIEKVLTCFKGFFPLLDPGGVLIITGTRYHDDDLYGYILSQLQDQFDICVIDCGMSLQKRDDNSIEIVGEPVFKHLTKGFLKKQFDLMNDPGYFSSQYCNKCLSSADMLFFRSQFVTVPWQDGFGDLSCYILTDTATSEKDEGCYSVAALVGLDPSDTGYVLDVAVGHWDPNTTVEQIIGMQERWQGKVNIHGIVMEKIGLNTVFKAMMHAEAADRNLRISIRDVPRGRTDDSKKSRIKSLQGRFMKSKIVFVSTIPRHFQDLGKTSVLYDPEGYTDPETQKPLPDGELVKEFIRFPSYGKNDIADCLADIDATDSKGFRICTPGSKRLADKRKQRRYRAGDVIPVPRMVKGVERLVDVMATKPQNSGDSWISKYRNKR